jgi:hypothetical protein
MLVKQIIDEVRDVIGAEVKSRPGSHMVLNVSKKLIAYFWEE